MSDAQRYFDVLRRIARDYQTPEQLRRHAQRDYGLDGDEAIEMAYENLRIEAANAIKGKRRPKE